jgi:outer membrane lipoprotein SlyB
MGGGGVLRVHDDGDVRTYDDRGANRDTTVQNGAIGAALGAIVGAIAGGGKGAAIGAIVGGSGGVILSQGHEQLELQRGAAVTLTVFNRR